MGSGSTAGRVSIGDLFHGWGFEGLTVQTMVSDGGDSRVEEEKKTTYGTTFFAVRDDMNNASPPRAAPPTAILRGVNAPDIVAASECRSVKA
jgi:hypothetical protein